MGLFILCTALMRAFLSLGDEELQGVSCFACRVSGSTEYRKYRIYNRTQ